MVFFAPRALKGGVCAAPGSSALVLFRSVFRFPWFYYLLNSLLIRHTLRNVNLYFNVILDISIRQSTGLKGYMLADTHRIIIVHLRKKKCPFYVLLVVFHAVCLGTTLGKRLLESACLPASPSKTKSTPPLQMRGTVGTFPWDRNQYTCCAALFAGLSALFPSLGTSGPAVAAEDGGHPGPSPRGPD